jgi:short-subunit dehydrogenase
MDLGLKGRIALVTGGSRGIGYAIASSLAAEGCNLHIAATTKATIDEAAIKLADQYGVKVTGHAYDLSDPLAAER